MAVFILQGCAKKDNFSKTPTIEWRSYEFEYVGDTTDNRRNILMKLYFNDGDGDIGREVADVDRLCEIESYDLLIHYYEKVNNAYVEVLPAVIEPPNNCILFHTVLPNLTPEGQNKTLEGDIFFPFEYFAFPENNNADSIQFTFELRDRAGNISPLARSASIPL